MSMHPDEEYYRFIKKFARQHAKPAASPGPRAPRRPLTPYPAPSIRACCTIDRRHVHLPPGLSVEEAISMDGKLWQPGDAISFGFLDGSPTQQAKAQEWIESWLQVANLHFRFGTPSPDVRITFTPGGSWSLIGTDCRLARGQATMQFGWVTDTSTVESDRAVIVHEAGHMLGLGHEQSSPLVDIAWNKPAAMQYYMSTQGWSAQMVQDNVFDVFDTSIVHGTAYDRGSIMQYPVPAELTTDGRGIPWNTELSPLDKSYVASLYPAAGPAPPPVAVTPVAPPLTPPVAPPPPPPTPPSVHPVIQVGQPAAHQRIPGPGQPAQFSLTIPADRVLTLSAQLQPGFGRDPIIVVQRGQEPALRLGLVHGKGMFRFGAGPYVVSVYNPFPRQTGVAWIKVA